ncbi:sodium:solute symporter family protein [Butyrivibrio fibrisolvens]|uniref:sodium:solute symporter family protein n=1 Tax=Butyrivibrio fibrisolvens TaxID=831 RepID=UPI000403963E|nr:sodium/solute symporter [Butyrivibrio fibrisolvens]
MAVKILFLIIFFSVMIFIGIATRKHAGNVEGFVLGGRSAGPWLTAFGYGTSYFSAVVFVGYAGQFGYKYGISATWAGIGNAVIGSLLAWRILGRRTRVMTKHLDSKTMPDFFGKRFESRSLRLAAALISFAFLIPYTSSVYNGLSRLFRMAFNIPYGVCVIVMAGLTCVYVILGGYMATVVNDFVQGVIMLFGISAVILAVLHNNGGFIHALTTLSTYESDLSVTQGMQGAFTSFFGPDPLNLMGVVILTSLGTWGLPQMVGKFYAIRDEKAIKAGTIISTLFAMVVAGGSYFLGGFARLYSGNAAILNADGSVAYDAIVPTMLSGLPDILIGIVIVLVLSASMSTLSSLVLTSSSSVTLDLVAQINKKMSDKAQLLTMRVLLVMFIALSVIVALNPPTFIAQLMGYSWGALAGSFLAPFLYSLYWKKTTKASVWACFISGVGITITNMIFHYIASPINAGAFTMAIGLVIVPVVSLLSPKMNEDHIDKVFDCYNQKVTVEKRYSLEEDENETEDEEEEDIQNRLDA